MADERKRSRVRIGKRVAGLLADPDYSDWTDEELVRGQRKSKHGRWHGGPPNVIPITLLQEINKRRCSKAYLIMFDAVQGAATYLHQVVNGKVEPDRDRIHACEIILNRALGREPQRFEIEPIEGDKWEQAGVTGSAIVLREVIDVDSEEFVDPFSEEAEG